MNKGFFNIYKFNTVLFAKKREIQNGICQRSKVTIPKCPTAQYILSSPNAPDKIEIDEKIIQHLERLSLVSLEKPEFLNNLKRSIQFAANIINVDTTNIEPLYTVLEELPLQMRGDNISVEHSREDILNMAKCIEEDYYVAPPGNVPPD